MSLRFHELVEELNRQLQRFSEDPEYDPGSEDGYIGLEITDYRMLRVVVHILLILQSLNAGFTPGTPHHEAAEGLIAAYIEFLGEINKHELIPLYAGRLSPKKAIDVMGGLLRKITSDAKRMELLKLMKLHNIDYVGCLKKGMENSLDLTSDTYEKERRGVVSLSTAVGEIQEEDEVLIQGLEWLVLGGRELRAEVVKNCTVVYKRLLRE
jgi:nuclear pore complex protein Nup107